jgi:hypothetical protein
MNYSIAGKEKTSYPFSRSPGFNTSAMSSIKAGILKVGKWVRSSGVVA